MDNGEIDLEHLGLEPLPVERAIVRRLEGVLGVHFPEAFRSVMENFGGSNTVGTHGAYFYSDGLWLSEWLNQLLSPDIDSGQGIMQWRAAVWSVLSDYPLEQSAPWSPLLVPFAGGSGSGAFCLEYRSAPLAPPVVFLDYGAGVEDCPLRYCAGSFTEFIGLVCVGDAELDVPDDLEARAQAWTLQRDQWWNEATS